VAGAANIANVSAAMVVWENFMKLYSLCWINAAWFQAAPGRCPWHEYFELMR